MILRELELRNIRSYREGRVTLSRGITLFVGDIGAGKSSLLQAVEFALFGTTGQHVYPRLIRKGEREARIRLTVETPEGRFILRRELQRGASGHYSQKVEILDPAHQLHELTVEEARDFVLRHILQIRESLRGKAQTYRYAIYTPQEHLRAILVERRQDRRDAIRRLLGLEDYRNAQEHAKSLAQRLKEEVARLEGETRDLSELYKRRERLETEREKTLGELQALRKQEKQAKKALEEARERLKHLTALEKAYREAQEHRLRLQEQLKGIEREEAHLQDQVRQEEELIRSAREELQALTPRLEAYEALKTSYEALREAVAGLPELRQTLETLRKERERVARELKAAEEAQTELPSLEKRVAELQEQLQAQQQAAREAEGLQERWTELQRELAEVEAGIRQHRKALADFEGLKGQARCPRCRQPLTEAHLRELREEERAALEELRQRKETLKKRAEALKKQLQRLQKLRENQNQTAARLGQTKTQLSHMRAQVKKAEELRQTLTALDGEIAEKQKQFSERKAKEARLQDLERKLRDLERDQKRAEQLRAVLKREAQLQALQERLTRTRQDRETLRRQLRDQEERLQKLEATFSPETLQEARKEELRLAGQLSALQAQIRAQEKIRQKLEEELKELRSQITRKEALQEKARRRQAVRNWLLEELIPALMEMERHRARTLREEFSLLFSTWFGELVGDSDLEGFIDDDFSPLVQYEGYDMELDALSGGERTAVALAYRLALNTLLKRALGIPQSLLILDEPTEGFSKDQIFRLKEVFDHLEADQIILVSHERELMNLADHIYEVRKEQGESRILKL